MIEMTLNAPTSRRPLALADVLADDLGFQRGSAVDRAIQRFFWLAEDGVAIFSQDDRLIVCNRAFCEISGISAEELVAAELSMVWQRVHGLATDYGVHPERPVCKVCFNDLGGSGYSVLELFPASEGCI